MEISAGLIVFVTFIFCYFVFGLKGAKRFVDDKLSSLFQEPEKRWLRYVLIAVAALFFAFIELARLFILLILKIVSFITGGK